MSKTDSYTAASVFPNKLLHKKVVDAEGRIIPRHIQVSPTNACNLDCNFCSCSDRDKEKSLTLDQILWVLDVCSQRKTEAITWTGGGEPLMHLDINDMLEYASYRGMKSGLVTNGILLERLNHHKDLTWCRVSSSDDRKPYYRGIEPALKTNPQTDWAFSHVVTRNPNYATIRDLILFANWNNFSHVRLVSDLCDLDNVPPMDEVRINLEGIDDSKVIYQGRKDSTPGSGRCHISLLKPVIAPEGIFPCCGVQYAIHGQPRDMTERYKMGDIEDLPKILDQQLHFNGSICEKCYYDQYNKAIAQLKNKPDHLEFV